MQKDVQFYLTYALCKQIGLSGTNAEKIAWANQYTNNLTEADLHGMQTQSSVLGNWEDRQIQLSVLVPFHFIPGSDQNHPWMTTRNNARARHLVDFAAKTDLFQFGIALHGLQDTFSHENFSGWREPLNSCFPWYYVKSTLPNVGHAEMRVIPDVVSYVWTDPRDGRRIDNKLRAIAAAKATYEFIAKFFNPQIPPKVWSKLRPKLQKIFKIDSYDKRIDELCLLSGNAKIDFKEVNKKLEKKHKPDFVYAASSHLAEAMRLLRDLPWLS